MNLLISSQNDPYQNLATEEYLLKNSQEDYIFLYVNKPCVVVGKHQITQKELNSTFIYEKKILVTRRLSGGGTVYHDEGNLNFSFIQSVPPGGSISYQQITRSIFGFLKEKVPGVEHSDRNDFILEGKKISGSAMHVYKNRLIAHGTLLINCNLTYMSAALKVDQDRFQDKSIPSRKAEVMNLSTAVNTLNISTLTNEFHKYLQSYESVILHKLSKSEVDSIQESAVSKYSQNNWIFGYSPKYTYTNNFKYGTKMVKYKLEVVKGLIESVSIEQSSSLNQTNELKMCGLKGMHHNIFDLRKELYYKINSSFYQALFDSLF